MTRVDNRGSHTTVLGLGLSRARRATSGRSRPPTTPALAGDAIAPIAPGTKVFAGQRAEGFYVDLGAIFDLGILRPFEQDHTTFGLANTGLGKMADGVNSTAGVNVHSIAIQVPINDLDLQRLGADHGDRPPCGASACGRRPAARRSGSWRSAVGDSGGTDLDVGPYIQVSRLGNPLVNEVVIPLANKDYWNTQPPSADSAVRLPLRPSRAGRAAARSSTPGCSPTWPPTTRHGRRPGPTWWPSSSPASRPVSSPGSRTSRGRPRPTCSGSTWPSRRPPRACPTSAWSAGDPAGFPNGRRVFDDVVTIELRAIAGATLPLVDPCVQARTAAAGAVSMG